MRESLREVIITLLIAIALVIATIYLFLQDWRTTLIPVITIPISLIGTFAFVLLLGFSINTSVLFGLTLATGLVVDDAIVVIENIARVMRENPAMTRREATNKGLTEIVGAVIATSLVLLAVFTNRARPRNDRRNLQAVRADDRLLDKPFGRSRANVDASAGRTAHAG